MDHVQCLGIFFTAFQTPTNAANITTHLPIVRPAGVVLPELIASLFQSQIWSKITNGQRRPGERIDWVSLEMFCDCSSLVGVPMLCNHRIMHDLKGNIVNEVVWNLLYNRISTLSLLSLWWPTLFSILAASAMANIVRTS